MTQKIRPLAIVGLSLALVACGGNSGSGGGTASSGAGSTPSAAESGTNATQATINSAAEGVWHGTSDRGNTVDLLILDKGEMYVLLTGSTMAGDLAFDQGSYSVKGDQFAFAGMQYSMRPIANGTITGTVTNGASPSIKGSAFNEGGTVTGTLAATPLTATDGTYQYSDAANMGAISGAWTSVYVLGQPKPFLATVNALGQLAVSNVNCSFVSTFTPRSSRKNVFDVTMEANQSPCTNSGKAYSGIAISYKLANGKQQLIAAMRSADKLSGVMLVAQR